MALARTLVAGCDVWLNTPERPREASGTSGMKAAMNGALNLSVLDGWWDEAPHDEAGFVVGEAKDQAGDEEIAQALYDALEKRRAADVLRPRRLGPAAALDRPHDRRGVEGREGLLVGPHGLGVPRGVLRARAPSTAGR